MTTNKTVTILACYYVKATSTIICTVRNGENKEYTVALHKSGNTTCTCKHGESAGNHAHCYHVKHVQGTEAARNEATRRGAVAETVYQIEECEKERAAYYAQLEEQHRTASLNGNRAFSLLRR